MATETNNSPSNEENLSNEDTQSQETIEVKSNETDFVSLNKELNDKYLRLYSDFENFRKRTLKERAELIKTRSEEHTSELQSH